MMIEAMTIRQLVDALGGQAQAARRTGTGTTTIHRWMTESCPKHGRMALENALKARYLEESENDD